MTGSSNALARAVSDGEDRLIAADDLLAGLQRRCGGDLPGTIAIPSLLETVRKARRYELRLARAMGASDGDQTVNAWVEVSPREDGAAGCDIIVRSWQTSELPPANEVQATAIQTDIDRSLADLTARLDVTQGVLVAVAVAADLEPVMQAMNQGQGRQWTEFFTGASGNAVQPMHWRLLDGIKVVVDGSPRAWRVRLFPLGTPGSQPTGFELCLVAEVPPQDTIPDHPLPGSGSAVPGLVGRDIAPVLRQPIARIIANAETIRTRLAGPLADEYAEYAADIASAGEHLLALLDDLADLEVVEAEEFSTAPDHIDLADVARRAAGILGVRARERGIVIDAPRIGESLPAIAEFRRVLQVLLNLVGNAIRYSPADSQIWIRLESDDGRARLIVADQGPGLDADQQARIFDKFERLGRGNDGGSGLGLYISRRLAHAMGGDLAVESAPGQGARFILDLPGDPSV